MDTEFLAAYSEQQLLKRESEFVEYSDCSLFLGTYNVNGRMPGEELDDWLFPNGNENQKLSDIYALGFQELDLSVNALLRGDETRAAPWEQLIAKTLAKRGDFELLASKQLVGMLLVVFVNKDLVASISDVLSDVEPVGIMGIMGNKGGVAVRFCLRDSTVCIINSHLNAHHANVRRRNQDFTDISERIRFATNPESGILQHDHVFWLGDLNYRINLPDDRVRSLTKVSDWQQLYKHDQLAAQQGLGLAFQGWSEQAIDFAPTYKYDVESTVYDTSEKRRAPAYCDRVLYMGETGEHCRALGYGRSELMSSDHRPVFAHYRIRCKTVVPALRAAVQQDIYEQLAKFENEQQPVVTLTDGSWELKPVLFGVEQRHVIHLHNAGPGAARFRFVAPPSQAAALPPWLSAEPHSAFIAPGSSLPITLRVLVKGSVAARLNMAEDEKKRALDAILVVHFEHGVDCYVSISGKYLRSSLGCTLEWLVGRPAPVRTTNAPVAARSAHLLVPKELWLLCDRLHRSLDERTLFQQSGEASEILSLREQLDTRADLHGNEASIHSVCELLVRWLGSLAEPVVPSKHYAEALNAAASARRCRQLVSYFPVEHYRAFYYVMALLKARVRARETHGKDETRAEVARLCALFGPAIVRPGHSGKPSLAGRRRAALFLSHFFEQAE